MALETAPSRAAVRPPGLLPALVAALALRALAIAASDRVVADVERYRRVADHVLDVSWNPYQAPRLYPYPPVWVWIEAGAGWLAREHGLSFPVLVKLPALAADLFIVGWLGRRHLPGAWVYALHPVPLLVGAFHGQFDALAMAFVLGALGAWESGRRDRSALLLCAAVALKSFPVLLVPLFLLALPEARARLRYAALALLPLAALLAPYALHDLPALRRELFGYGGVADFGWIGVWRGLRWLAEGALARGEAARWPLAVAASKVLFGAAYAAFLWTRARGASPQALPRACLLVLLGFLGLYGALSAQYLLWVVPLAALRPGRALLGYTVAATVALLGFYAFLAPGVLAAAAGPPPWLGGLAWVGGAALTLAAVLGWLALLWRQGEGGRAGEGGV